MPEATAFIAGLRGALTACAGAALHCRMGIGRSSLMAASILVADGLTVSDAFGRIQRARGVAVPDTEAQVQWVEQYASVSHFTTDAS